MNYMQWNFRMNYIEELQRINLTQAQKSKQLESSTNWFCLELEVELNRLRLDKKSYSKYYLLWTNKKMLTINLLPLLYLLGPLPSNLPCPSQTLPFWSSPLDILLLVLPFLFQRRSSSSSIPIVKFKFSSPLQYIL